MRIAGESSRASRKVAACSVVVAAVVGLGACSSSVTSAGGDTGSASSSSPSSPPSSRPSLPSGCHGGVAKDVQSTLTLLTDPANCPGSVNAYWRSKLGAAWTMPTFIAYSDGQVPRDACGLRDGSAGDFTDNAFYCPTDDTVAYSRELLDSLLQAGGPYLPVVVLMHELGHRADRIAHTEGPISRSEENQADCSAGATTAYARTAHRLPFSDVLKSAQVLYQLGDRRHFGSELAQSPDAHGTPFQRVTAFSRGYFQGISACRKIGQSATGSVL